MRSLFLAAVSSLFFSACSHPAGLVKHYQLFGRVVSLDAKDHVATIDTKAIPNWMEAMTMEYPVKSASDFDGLKVGEAIQATLNVRGAGDYDLTDVRPQAAASK